MLTRYDREKPKIPVRLLQFRRRTMRHIAGAAFSVPHGMPAVGRSSRWREPRERGVGSVPVFLDKFEGSHYVLSATVKGGCINSMTPPGKLIVAD
jgi:hypothetical protein